MTDMTPEQLRRAVTTAMESRAHAAALAAQAKGSDDANLRQRALTAWRAAQADERIVREAPLEVIAAAVGTARPLVVSGHMDMEEMREMLELHAQGFSVAIISARTGRSKGTVLAALKGWRAGTSRLARRAKELGVWPRGKESA